MTLHLLISGKVQGVFFRAESKDVAEKIGVKGWIKNTPNDKVEAIVNGTKEQVMIFVDWCHRGPQRAVVTEVEATEIAEQHFEEFKVIR